MLSRYFFAFFESYLGFVKGLNSLQRANKKRLAKYQTAVGLVTVSKINLEVFGQKTFIVQKL
ncbi:hypothetical protein JZO67_004169 [Enterococcus sp. 665A]|uniref:Transposase n=1 Tax=Candidatus Enterococcus ferrettii TaxID=2815324 RepID=A0ABV0EU56_9ENTE